jgi:neurotransmitter:Na+ symporter, NSS family
MSNRGNFSSRLGFILAAAGSAVGLGNIWRFPFLAGTNGGAGFLFIYLICILTLCVPVMIGEIAIGRNAGSDAYGSYNKLGGGKWGYLGYYGILAGIIILSFYNVVAGWAFGYFIEISFGDLLTHENVGQFFGEYVNDIPPIFIFSLVFMVMTAFIVARGISKGIEAANKIMMPGLYIILIVLIIYSLTLPNAMAGVDFYLIPKLDQINIKTLFYALSQAFFSLSLGMGCLITFGSYVTKDQNIVKSAAIISAADTSVAFLAGLMVFPLVFSLGAEPGQGPKLIFVILTQAFQSMGPVMGRIMGGSFFLLICFAALTSTLSLLEVPTAFFVDTKKLPRKAVVWSLAGLIFVLGLPSMFSQGIVPMLNKLPVHNNPDFLSFVSDLCDITLISGGCFMCFFIRNKWKVASLDKELAIGNPTYLGSFLQSYINFSISWVCPVILSILTTLVVIDKFFGLEWLFG